VEKALAEFPESKEAVLVSVPEFADEQTAANEKYRGKAVLRSFSWGLDDATAQRRAIAMAYEAATGRSCSW